MKTRNMKVVGITRGKTWRYIFIIKRSDVIVIGFFRSKMDKLLEAYCRERYQDI